MAKEATMPPNFSWVEEGELCVMGMPVTHGHMQFLREQKVKLLVSLTAEANPPAEDFPDIEVVPIKIKDFSAPTLDQVEKFMTVVERGKQTEKAVGVHCSAGMGRTGSMLSCYMVKHKGLSAAEAIENVRFLRPGSVETTEQEEVVTEYESHLKK